MEGSRHKNHKDHIAGKGMNSPSHYNLVHNFIPMPKAMIIPDAKAPVEKEREKLEKIPASCIWPALADPEQTCSCYHKVDQSL